MPFSTSVSHLIPELCARHAARTALVDFSWDAASGEYCRGASTTYADLYEDTLRLISALSARGVGAGDRVAVLLDNSAEMVVTEWACLLSGMVWVALNVRSSATEQSAILDDCTPSVVIVSERYRAQVAAEGLPTPCLVVEVGATGGWDSLLASAASNGRARAVAAAEDVVRIRYTSGTAGLPKGAVLPRRCYDASVEVVRDVIGPLHQTDVLAQVAPMTHAAGAMWLPHAVVGATALLLDRFDAAAFVRLVRREGVTSAFLVPTMLLRFVEALSVEASGGLGSDLGGESTFAGNSDASAPLRTTLRSIVYGGAAMPVDRLERGLQLLGPIFVQIYGLTESNWPVTALRREEHLIEGSLPKGNADARRRRLSSCGRPTAIGEVRIVQASGQEAPAGESGELLVRGRNTMLGYWGKGRGDAKGLDEDGWMHTGDIAVRDAEGFLTIVDRLHDLIVSGGFNVYPREVEDALSSHPAVLEAAVVGREDAQWGERVHAVVVLRPGAAVKEKELADHVGERTAAYKKPRSFDFVAELPKNAAGKVLRRTLKTTMPTA